MSKLGGKLVAIRQLTLGPEISPSTAALRMSADPQLARTPVPAVPRLAFLTKSRRFRWSMVCSKQTPSAEKILDGRFGHLAHGVFRQILQEQ